MTTKPRPRSRHARDKDAWRQMFARCYDPRRKDFKNYGGRGIFVCERWRSFDAFLQDMGPRPEGMTLDRIDVDGPYAPGNVRWATRAEQGANRRRRTHCMKGLHVFTPQNTLADKTGARRCRACRRAYVQQRAIEQRHAREQARGDVLAAKPPSLVQMSVAGTQRPLTFQPRCVTCMHPRRADAELLAAKGYSPRVVIEAVNLAVSVEGLRNHLAKHVPLADPEVIRQVDSTPLPQHLKALLDTYSARRRTA